MNIRNKLIKFMYGRYGVDELYKFLFLLYIITFIINIFLNNIFLEILGLIIILIMFYRVLSKNIYKKCPKCKTTLKLPIPYARGIKHTNCPKCKKRLTLFVLKKQKIEIIKNKK